MFLDSNQAKKRWNPKGRGWQLSSPCYQVMTAENACGGWLTVAVSSLPPSGRKKVGMALYGEREVPTFGLSDLCNCSSSQQINRRRIDLSFVCPFWIKPNPKFQQARGMVWHGRQWASLPSTLIITPSSSSTFEKTDLQSSLTFLPSSNVGDFRTNHLHLFF